MKKLINDPRMVVREMLEGIVMLSPGLALLEGEMVVLQADIPADPAQRPVAMLSGGGSGHEPAHAGYVGHGMLSAAVAGDVFTSPSVDAVLAAIRAVGGPAGAVIVVKNYTGDRLNFGLAAELAAQEGIPAEVVVVADDVSLHGLVPAERRRGIAGTVLVHKVAGAAAASGASLAEVARVARAVAAAVGTMGVGLTACTVPAAGKPGFELGEDEIEYGLGIHGEKGVRRGELAPADEVVATILDAVLADLKLPSGARVVLLVNGLGGTPEMELAIVARRALALLAERGHVVERAYVGNYMTALEMAGCSLSVLPVDEEVLQLLDATTTATAWRGDGRVADRPVVLQVARAPTPPPGEVEVARNADLLRRVVLEVAAALEGAEDALTDLDARTGDGDLGASMARGAAAARALPPHSYASASRLLADLGDALRRSVAGSSGPFYATALLRAARQVQGSAEPGADEWQAALESAIAAIAEIGGAKPGDRTMLDALAPALAAWRADGWAAAVSAAERGAQETADMVPQLGRASYLGERALGVPDGGAIAVSIWLRAIDRALA